METGQLIWNGGSILDIRLCLEKSIWNPMKKPLREKPYRTVKEKLSRGGHSFDNDYYKFEKTTDKP